MKYAHFIFDLDGTLVDSASEIHQAAAAVCSAYSLAIPSLAYIREMTGSPPVCSSWITAVARQMRTLW